MGYKHIARGQEGLDWALMDAVRLDNLQEVRKLLGKGANASLPTLHGKTPLHVAAYYTANKRVFRELIKNGADFNIRCKDGLTPIYFAEMHGKTKSIKILKGFGAI